MALRYLTTRIVIWKNAGLVRGAVQQYAQPSHERAPDQELRVVLERVDEDIGLKAQLGHDE